MKYYCSNCSAETTNGFDCAVFSKRTVSRTTKQASWFGLPIVSGTIHTTTTQLSLLGMVSYAICGSCARTILPKRFIVKHMNGDPENLDYLTYLTRISYKVANSTRRILLNNANFEEYIVANGVEVVTEEDLRKFLTTAKATESLPDKLRDKSLISYKPPEIFIGFMLEGKPCRLIFNHPEEFDLPEELRQYTLKVYEVLQNSII